MTTLRFLTLVLSFVGLVSQAEASLFAKKVSHAHVETLQSVVTRLDAGDSVATVTDEWFHRRMTGDVSSDRALRALQRQNCDEDTIGACAFVSIFSDDVDLYGSCGGLARDKDEAWCYSEDLGQDVCCGDSDDCCEVKIGLVVVILLVIVIFFIASICACCYCCKCCCLYDKFHGNAGNNADAAPVTVVTAAETTK